MKKSLALLFALLLLSAMPVMAEMTGDEIIAKHVQATGGEKTMREIKSLSIKGSMFMQGMPLDMQMYVVPPNKSNIQVSSNNMVLGGGGTNGTEAWATQMGETYMLTGKQKDEAAKQADQFVFLDYKKEGAVAKNLGEDMVKGAKAYKVEFVSAGHDTTLYFFDAASFYLLREKNANTNQNFSKHKAVGGIVFPFSISSQVEMGGQSMQQMITFDSIAVNVPVAESLFVMPKNAKPMPTAPTAPVKTEEAPAKGTGK